MFRKHIITILFLLLVTVLFHPVVYAYTYSGQLMADTQWQGEVIVTGDVVIPEGKTLTIMPGTIIKFISETSDYDYMIMKTIADDMVDVLNDDRSDLVVRGTLIAMGEENRRIVFESEGTGRGIYNQWGSIYFFGDDQDSILEHVMISNATIAVFCWESSGPRIRNSIIAGNRFGIVALDSSNPEVTANVIRDNKFGIAVYDTSAPEISGNRINRVEQVGVGTRGKSAPRMSNNVIRDNDVGIGCYDSSSPEIFSNEISGNRMGISLLDKSAPKIHKNLIMKNMATGIEIKDLSKPLISNNKIEMNTDGISYSISSKPELKDNVFNKNKEEIVVASGARVKIVSGALKKNSVWKGKVHVVGDVFIPKGITLSIAKGSEITFEPNRSRNDQGVVRNIDENDMTVTFKNRCDIIVEGTIKAAGAKEQVIKIGNPNPASDVNKIAWGSIFILGEGSASLLEYTRIEYASIGVSCWDETRPTIANSDISSNRIGIDCSSNSAPEIKNNVISKNDTYAVICRENSTPIITGNKVSGNNVVGIGVRNNALPRINKNEIRDNKTGIDCSDSSMAQISNNVIAHNDRGVECYNDSLPYVYENKFLNNRIAVIYRESGYPKMKSNIFSNNLKKIVHEK